MSVGNVGISTGMGLRFGNWATDAAAQWEAHAAKSKRHSEVLVARAPAKAVQHAAIAITQPRISYPGFSANQAKRLAEQTLGFRTEDGQIKAVKGQEILTHLLTPEQPSIAQLLEMGSTPAAKDREYYQARGLSTQDLHETLLPKLGGNGNENRTTLTEFLETAQRHGVVFKVRGTYSTGVERSYYGIPAEVRDLLDLKPLNAVVAPVAEQAEKPAFARELIHFLSTQKTSDPELGEAIATLALAATTAKPAVPGFGTADIPTAISDSKAFKQSSYAGFSGALLNLQELSQGMEPATLELGVKNLCTLAVSAGLLPEAELDEVLANQLEYAHA